MKERQILILGLLLSHGMHGYQLNELLKKNPGMPISLTKSNAYKLLNDMENDGWVTYIEEQEGNRPVRRVYSVTEKGEQAFKKMLRETLSTYAFPELPSVVGLDFLHMLPDEEVVSLLERRLNVVKDKFGQLEAVSEEIRKSHLTTDYLHRYYAGEVEWLTEILNDRMAAIPTTRES
jgi:DNA-binding PadR family transcriptional regulator